MSNFWKALPVPFTILAPMDGVTDVVFREIITRVGKPDVLFSEFTNVEALNSAGKKSQIERLKFTESEHPIVAQIWGVDPKNFYKSAIEVSMMGFDGIDINMGCPDRSVLKSGSCAGLIKNRKLAGEIINATIEGSRGLPVSVKTRLGFDDYQTEDWIYFLLGFDLKALSIHARTVRQMSKVAANWDEILKAVKIRDQLKKDTLIIGNGDVENLTEVLEKHKKYGVDGVMIGRGIFKNPWLFKKEEIDVSVEQRLDTLLMHAKLFTKTWGDTKNFAILKKFFKIYINGFTKASKLRADLMETKNLAQVKEVIAKFKSLG